MIIGITGASGLVGKHLLSGYLKTDVEVRLLSRNPQRNDRNIWFHGDLTDSNDDLDQFLDGVDVLFHCAGELNDEEKMYDLHVEGTRNIAKAAVGKVKRWVQLSSVGVYGPKRNGVIDEYTKENPVGVYETSKAESDRVLVNIAEEGDMEYVILRPSNIFSVDMKNRSIYRMIEMIRKGLFFYIGEKGAIVNYIHVCGVVAALMLCAVHKNACNKTLIVSDYIYLEDMVTSIAAGLNVKMPSLRLPEKIARGIAYVLRIIPGSPLTKSRIDALTGRARYDSMKIMNDLGYGHPTTLGDAFFEMAQTRKKNIK